MSNLTDIHTEMANTTFSENVTDIGLSNTTFSENVTELFLNVTVTKAPPARRGPPPVGYYGDMRKTLWTYVPPILICTGTIGNILTIIVLLRQLKRLSSTAIFLLALALSDTVVLWCGPFRNWYREIMEIDVRTLTDAGCRTQMFLTYVSIQYSSWLLAAVTIERVLSVILPHKVRFGCTTRNASLITVGIFILVCGLNVILPIMVSLDNTFNKRVRCSSSTQEFYNYQTDYLAWVDFAAAFALPFVIIMTGNIIIMVNLVRAKKRQRQMNVKQRQGGDTTKSLTILLTLLSAIFFITMTPVTVFLIYYPYRFEEILKIKDPFEQWYAYQNLMFYHAIFNIVGYTNASINFILYVFSGSRFRAELQALFLCKKPGSNGIFGTKTTSSSGKTKTSVVANGTGGKNTKAVASIPLSVATIRHAKTAVDSGSEEIADTKFTEDGKEAAIKEADVEIKMIDESREEADAELSADKY